MVDAQKLNALLGWMLQSIGSDLIAIVVVDRQGLVMASSMKMSMSDEVLGGIAAIVEPVLIRISSEFQAGRYGTGSFDTADHRLIFCEAGSDAILVLVADGMAGIDAIFPYSYLCAEKVARILDGRSVSPVIPTLTREAQLIEGGESLKRIGIGPGRFITKIALLGDGAVGKTTLVNQFIEAQFETDYKSTIGASIMKKSVFFDQWGIEVGFSIFDLAGQTQFQRVRQTYLQGAKAALLVFDVTRPETFDSVERWYNEAIKVEPDMMIILIGNKIDLDRKITEKQGKELAERLHLAYFETSALNKDIVDETFRTLAFLFLQRNNPTLILSK